ncbi:MAG: hypothetical protein ACKO96_15285 [Flammeovirgaceae bacterium]
MKTVNTQLAVGGVKDYIFGDNGEYIIPMHDNKKFCKIYASVEEFLKDFKPAKMSDNLMRKIQYVFSSGGKFTFKPMGYKANMVFYIS